MTRCHIDALCKFYIRDALKAGSK